MQNKLKTTKSIISQQSGATAIEYAFILPVLLLLIFGMLETCMVFYASAVLTGGTITAARLAKTGYNNTGTSGTCAGVGQTRSQFITCIVQSKVGALLNPSLLQITSKSYSSFSNIGQPEPYTDLYGLGYYVATDPYTDINGNGQWDSDMGVAGLGGAGDIVVYKVSYPWHISTPMLQNIMSSNGTLTISASAVVKNEPYGTTTSR